MSNEKLKLTIKKENSDLNLIPWSEVRTGQVVVEYNARTRSASSPRYLKLDNGDGVSLRYPGVIVANGVLESPTCLFRVVPAEIIINEN